jgi:BirA family biotin operon repressor/biotin-[acetyl-CoA-carboxylase] ligase
LLENATSLKTELRTRISLEQLLKTLLERLENAYALFMNQGFDPILKEWKKYASFLGSQVEVTTTTEKWKGTAFDVDNDGSLMLKLGDETTRRVMAGDIQIHPNKHETNSH